MRKQGVQPFFVAFRVATFGPAEKKIEVLLSAAFAILISWGLMARMEVSTRVQSPWRKQLLNIGPLINRVASW